MENVEKITYFARLKFVNNNNTWSNGITMATYSNSQYNFKSFTSNTDSILNSLTYTTNRNFTENKTFRVLSIKIFVNPLFVKYYHITTLALNKKKNQTDIDLYDNSILEFNATNNIYSSDPNTNIVIYTNLTISLANLHNFIKITAQTKLSEFINQSQIQTTMDLSTLDVFLVEISGIYINNEIKNVNILSNNLYYINIRQLDNEIIITENDISLNANRLEISILQIRNITENSFISQQPDIANMNRFINVPGKIKTYFISQGTMNFTKIGQDNGEGVPQIIDILNVTGGILTIYNIKNSEEPDKIMNFYVEISSTQVNRLPNPNSNRVYIYSQDIANPNNLTINNSNPIVITASNLVDDTSSGQYFPPQFNNENALLSTNGLSTIWSKNLNILSVTASDNITSTKNFFAKPGISANAGYNFSGSTLSGLRYNSADQSCCIVNDGAVVVAAQKNLVTNNVPLNFNMNASAASPNIIFNNVPTGIFSSPTSTSTLAFACSGVEAMSVTPTALVVPTSIDCNGTIQCNTLDCPNIGTSITSGTLKAQNLECNTLVCDSIQYTGGTSTVVSESVIATTISAQQILTVASQSDPLSNSITTGKLTAETVQSNITKIATGSATNPSIQFGDKTGIYQSSSGSLNISNGTTQLMKINAADGLVTEKISTTNATIGNINLNSKIISIDTGTRIEPVLQFSDKSGIYQSEEGKLNFAVKNPATQTSTNILTVDSSGISAINIDCASANADNITVNNEGTAASPSVKFPDNSGIFQQDENQINFSTNSTNRLTISSAGIIVPQNITCENNTTSSNMTVNNTLTSNTIQCNNLNIAQKINLDTNSLISFKNNTTNNVNETTISQNSNGGILVKNNASTLFTVDASANSVSASNIVASATLQSQSKIVLNKGTISNPSVQFADTSGMYQQADGSIYLAVKSGASRLDQLKVDSTGITVINDITSQQKIWCQNLRAYNLIEGNTMSCATTSISNKVFFNTSTGSQQNPLIEFFRGTRIFEVDASTGGLRITNSSGTELLGVTADRLTVNKITASTEIYSQGTLIVSSGSTSSPAIRFANNSGIYQQSGSTEIDFAIGGQKKLDIQSTIVNVYSNFTSSGKITGANLESQNETKTISLTSETINNKYQLKFLENGTDSLPSILFKNNTIINELSTGGIVIKNGVGASADTLMTISNTKLLDINSIISTTITSTNINVSNLNGGTNSVFSASTVNIADKINVPNGTVLLPSVRFSDGSGIYQSQTGNVDISIGVVNVAQQTTSYANKLTISNDGILVPDNISCSNQITCANLSSTSVTTGSLTVNNTLTLNDKLVVQKGTSANPSIYFVSDSTKTGIYQSSNGKINISTTVSGVTSDIAEFNSQGIVTSKKITTNELIANSISTTSLSANSVTCNTGFTCQRITLTASGSISNPVILLPSGTGIYELSNSGLAIVGKDESNQTIELLNINRQRLLTVNQINTSTLSAATINVSASISCIGGGVITASNIVSQTSLQVSDGTSTQPGLKFADGTGLYQTTSGEIIVGKNGSQYLKIDATGLVTPNNFNCTNISCSIISCATLNMQQGTLTANTINVGNLNLSNQLVIVNGTASNPGIKFGDRSGMYLGATGQLGFSDGTRTLLLMDYVNGLSTIYKIVTSSDIQAGNVIANSNINCVNLTSSGAISTSSLSSSGKVSINWGSSSSPAIQLFNGATMGIKIYQSSENELKIDKGASTFLTINNSGISTANNISSSGQVSGNTILCDSISTSLNNITNSVTTNTLISAIINLSGRINMPDGTITNPSFRFEDGSGIYQSSENGVDFAVGNDTSEPKLSVISTGISSPNVNAVNSFYVSTAGSPSALTLKNGINSTTGIWVNEANKQVGISTEGTNVCVITQNGLGVTGSCNISESLLIGSSGTVSFPSLTIVSNNSGFYNEGSNVCLSIAGVKRFEGNTSGVRVNGSYTITSGTSSCGYITNGTIDTRNIAIYDSAGTNRLEATSSGINMNGTVKITSGTLDLTLNNTNMTYSGQIVITHGGTAGAPSLRLAGNLGFTSGFYCDSNGEVYCTTGGNVAWYTSNGGLVVPAWFQGSYSQVGHYIVTGNRTSPASSAFNFQFGSSNGFYAPSFSTIRFFTGVTSGFTGTDRLEINTSGISVTGNVTCTGNIVPQGAIQPNISYSSISTGTIVTTLSSIMTRTDGIIQLTAGTAQTNSLQCDTNPTTSLKFSIYLFGSGTKTNTFSLTNGTSSWGSGNHSFFTNFSTSALSATSYTWTEPKIEKIDFIYNYNSTTPTSSQWVILKNTT